MRVLWSFFIVIIAIHGSLTQVVVPKKPAFLIALPYALDDTTGDFEFDVFSSLRLLVYGMHLSSNLAVKDVMVEYDIPKDAIEFVYINTWNPEFGSPDTYFLSDSGAYTATAIYEVIQQYNVIGIFGDIFSRTTRFSAGLASYFQKPFCGATQGSITLSEKINYPYFYRMVTARGGGKHYLSVLKFYGMKTLCIFRTSDDLSRSVAEEVKQEAIKQGVNVVSITFGDELFQTNDFKHQFRLAKRQNCKFIFASMSWVSLSILYDAGITYGLVGPDNLWSSYNIARPLDSANTTIIKEYWGFLQIIDASPIGTQWRNFSQRGSPRANLFWERERGILVYSSHVSGVSSVS
ncbi:periplasmic binding protein-like I [Chytridium lagenaria]|nr:periplasmic binding protein-like I [Chytridium lagenaria]